jgi:hypothetical protein
MRAFEAACTFSDWRNTRTGERTAGHVSVAGAVPVHAQTQGTWFRAGADAVCSFIRERMLSALPQVPSFCAVENKHEHSPSLYQLSVFSPVDVLEGKMRRA